ncbi:hypothetical protein ERX35_007790 [Macrococcus equipercicus]|uniref:Uncharacterized protein n=1 Tax=Macrococcus equipercicus TaxID=69967 RepID=A0ABQ6R7N8_9STAP|nr:hypothetical protein [Macrococcus equipercicus]KAA1039108.1 hypothetical protein ERX35_007790 [Macrococcus equipercicus]
MKMIAGNNVVAKLKNLWIYVPIILSAFMPVMAMTNTSLADLNSWPRLHLLITTFFSNPYLIITFLTTLYASLKSFDIKGAWRDSRFNQEKVGPTDPDMEVIIKGQQEVTDQSQVKVDNTKDSQ